MTTGLAAVVTANRPPHPHVRQHHILRLVRNHPGITKSHVSAALGLAWGTMCRDVQALLDAGALLAHRVGRDSLLYRPQDAPQHPSQALEHASDILDELEHGAASAVELSRRIRATQAVIQNRLDALEADGLISSAGHAPRLYHRTG